MAGKVEGPSEIAAGLTVAIAVAARRWRRREKSLPEPRTLAARFHAPREVVLALTERKGIRLCPVSSGTSLRMR